MVVEVGLILLLQIPLPVPVTVPPPLLKVKVHDPFDVIVPPTEVESPLQIKALGVVMDAAGRGFTISVIGYPTLSQAVAEFQRYIVPVCVPGINGLEITIGLAGKIVH